MHVRPSSLFLFAFLVILSHLASSQDLVPTAQLALLKGRVTNFKGRALSNETVLLVNDKSKSIIRVTTDAAGKFQVLAPISATYSMKYKTFTTDVDYTKMVLGPDKEATYEVLIKIDPPKDFVLENVYFETGKSNLKPKSYKALNDLVEVLSLKNSMVVEIQGHTDNVGKEADNLNLSQERANEVRKYLISKGITEDRILAKGYGQNLPIADNATETGRAKNRRTSLKVLKE